MYSFQQMGKRGPQRRELRSRDPFQRSKVPLFMKLSHFFVRVWTIALYKKVREGTQGTFGLVGGWVGEFSGLDHCGIQKGVVTFFGPPSTRSEVRDWGRAEFGTFGVVWRLGWGIPKGGPRGGS